MDDPTLGDRKGTPVPKRRLSSGSEFAGMGLQLGVTFAVFALAGHWLDGKFGTAPWLTIVLVFVGAAAALYSVYRRVIGPGTKR